MSILYRNDVEITRYVKAIKNVEQKKIALTLLDGTDSVQNFGDPVTRFNLEIITDLSGRDQIDEIDVSGELVKLEDEGSDYFCRILQKEPWDKLVHNIFQTGLILSVEVVE